MLLGEHARASTYDGPSLPADEIAGQRDEDAAAAVVAATPGPAREDGGFVSRLERDMEVAGIQMPLRTVGLLTLAGGILLGIGAALAIGSAIGRPELADLLAAKFVALCVRFAGVLQPLQEKGIVRADLDLVAFAAWFTGSVTGRLFIEFQRTPIDADAWNRIFKDAVLGAVLPPTDA